MLGLDVVGSDVKALGATAIVTGEASYCADLHFPDMLVGKLLYSRYPSARIRRLDVSAARALPGVLAVLTHKDILGENSYFFMRPDQPLLVTDRARYLGDALAAVAAIDEQSALAALAAIQVEYEPLVGVYDSLEALKPGAPRVWPDHDNVCAHVVIERGDIGAGFAEADVVIENTYRSPLMEHAFLELEGAVALVERDGTMVVHTCSQAPHRDRFQIARSLALPENQVRVVVPYVGGGFGGKDEGHVQIHAALLAQATGRPVRILRTREESILTHVKRHPVVMRYRTGAKKDGRLTAVETVSYGDTGPYTNAGPYVMEWVAVTSVGPYAVPNVRLESYTVFTNNPICGAMRGFGIPQACLAYESQMDALAHALGLDPMETRLRNGLETGDLLPRGDVVREGAGMKASLREAARLSGWEYRHAVERRAAPHLRRGWGLASNWFLIGMGRGWSDHAGAYIEMSQDGSVVLHTGAVELGQGAYTALAMLTAETLGVELSSVRVIGADTDRTPDAGATAASRQSFVSGNAVLRAAEVIRKELLTLASEETGSPIEVLSLHGGRLYAETEALSVTVADLAAKAWEHNRRLHADGYYAIEYPQTAAKNGSGVAASPATFSTQAAQVLVDTETGEVKVERLVAVLNAGRMISRGGAYSQLEGGCIMGLGHALTEELVVEEGRTVNTTLASYLIPTAADVPTIDTKILEIAEPGGPLGVSGIGEPPVATTSPAILNAVSDALGVPLREIPLTSERILAAIEAYGKAT